MCSLAAAAAAAAGDVGFDSDVGQIQLFRSKVHLLHHTFYCFVIGMPNNNTLTTLHHMSQKNESYIEQSATKFEN